jgi:ABC-type dipeptide/oligopeptide/nickel transport system permease subunit
MTTAATNLANFDTDAPPGGDDQRLSRAWTRFVRSPSAWLGSVISLFILVVAMLAPWISPYEVDQRDAKFLPPSAKHWFGTDSNEYDVLSRTLHGSRLSLLAGGLSVLLAVVIGATAGAVAGYLGGWIDAFLMRSLEVLLAFPAILIALLALVALQPGWPAVIVAVALINVPLFARQVRATVLSLREQEYVQAAIALGADPWYVLSRVLLPSLVSPIIVLATLGLASAILEVAGLAFLGIAGDASAAEWGLMLSDAKDHTTSSLWPAIAPGVAISLTILGFNLLGDGLRDALDPKLDTHGSGLPS